MRCLAKQTHYIFFILLSIWTFGKSLTIKNFLIKDLEYNSTDFVPEAQNWISSFSHNVPSCAETYLLGGYQINFPTWTIRTYDNLPVHNSVLISFQFWLIDKWEPDASFRFCIISSQYGTDYLPTFKFTYDETKWSGQVCGDKNEHDLMPVTFLIQAPHSSTLTFHIHFTPSSVLSSTSYFGVRDFNVLLSTRTVSTTSFCILSSFPTIQDPSQNCHCPRGKYWNTGTGQCDPCDGSCENCFGPTSSECYSCNIEYSYNGQQCVPCESLSPSECVSCRPGRYLYEDSICRDRCDYPYNKAKRNGRSYCISPCVSGKYFYANGSCLADCTSPFVKKSDGKIDTCDFPCDTNKFMYPNGSCLGECPSPLVTEVKWSKYKYCKPPCQNSSLYYYPNETVCKEQCSLPNITNITTLYKICNFVVNITNDTIVANQTSNPPPNKNPLSYTVGMLASAGLKVSKALSAGNPASLSIGVITKMLSYIKYLDVKYSEELQEALKTWKSSFFSLEFMPQAPEEIETGEESVPFTFAKYDISARFLVNIWNDLMLNSIIVAVYIFLWLVEWVSRALQSKFLPYSFAHKAMISSQNFLLAQINGLFGDILIYSIIEYKSVDFSTELPILSFTFSTLALVLILVSFVFYLFILLKYQKIKNSRIQRIHFIKKREGFKMIFDVFNDKTFTQHSCLLIFLARDLIFSLILTVFFEYPRLQTIMITTLNIIMLLYLVLWRPFKDLIDLFQQLFCELMLLTVNVSVLIMATAESVSAESANRRNVLGKLIIVVNIVCSFAILGFLAIQTLLGVKEYLKKRRRGQQTEKDKIQMNMYLTGIQHPDVLQRRIRLKVQKPELNMELAQKPQSKQAVRGILNKTQKESLIQKGNPKLAKARKSNLSNKPIKKYSNIMGHHE